MRAWFDIRTLDVDGPLDWSGITFASLNIHRVIMKEINQGIPSNRIVVGGFSQGGALALHSVLTFKERVAGIVALSSWLPMSEGFAMVSI